MLGDVCSIKARIGWQGLKKSEYMDSGYYSLVSGTDFKNGFIDWGACSFVSEWRYNQDRNIQLRNGDVLVTKDGTIGKVAYVKGMTCPTTLNSGVFVIRPSNDELQPSFLQLIFKSRFFREFLDRITAGSTIVHLYQKDIVEFDFPIPNIAEQCRIAHAIEIIDGHLSKIKHLISKYEAIKKATVNLLLEPRPGWEKVKFSDVCSSFEYGVGAPAMSFDGRNKYIRITDIDDTSHEFKPTPLSSPTFFDNNHVVRDGDILFARTGASVGKSYLYCPTDGKLIFAGFLIRASICTNVVDPKFIFLQTLTAGYRQWVSEESMRSGQPGLNINQYKDFELYLPELSEQRKIATQISAIDNVLKDCHAQLAKAQNLKQGMMSYFFG